MEDHSFEDLIENLFDGVYYVDRNRTITYWNAGAERITGYARDDVLGKTCAANILRHIDDTGTELCQNGCPLAATLADGQNREISVYLHHNSGHRLPVSVRVSPLRDADGNITGAAEVFTENAELHQVLKDLEALRFKVNRDELTGVSNRRAAEAALKTRLFELQQFGTPLGLIFLDIDHFKHINDTYGHAVGDQVLRLAANTITAALHRGDLLARWGGEEFLVLIADVDAALLARAAERVRMFIERSFLMIDGEKLSFTASLGATLALPEDTPESLVARADALMYRSKEAGRNRVSL